MLTKKKIKLIVLYIVVFTSIALFNYSLLNELKMIDDTSCHYSNLGDSLPQMEESFVPPEKSIHFHETSCRGRGMDSRQACSVESAARVHPTWQIIVYFTGPLTNKSLDSVSLRALKKYKNIMFLRLHLQEFAKDTPLKDFISAGTLNRSQWPVSHTSDALRLLTLYKWGGVYLDLDMIVTRPFEDLAPNWAVQKCVESLCIIESAVLAFSRDLLGRNLAEATIMGFKKHFNGDSWADIGPLVLTRALLYRYGKAVCDYSAKDSSGFEIYKHELFYPVDSWNVTDLFESKPLDVGSPYTYHIWNKLSKHFPVSNTSVYATLAQKYCPEIYGAYGDEFGNEFL